MRLRLTDNGIEAALKIFFAEDIGVAARVAGTMDELWVKAAAMRGDGIYESTLHVIANGEGVVVQGSLPKETRHWRTTRVILRW